MVISVKNAEDLISFFWNNILKFSKRFHFKLKEVNSKIIYSRNETPFVKEKRRKNIKINNLKRRKLLDLVNSKVLKLKEAANLLEINQSSAKTIYRTFKLEKRISKKNIIEENYLREIFEKEKNLIKEDESK